MHVGGMRLFRYEEGEMQKWEYMEVEFYRNENLRVRRINDEYVGDTNFMVKDDEGDMVEPSLIEFLMMIGKSGWEVVAIDSGLDGNVRYLIAKRPYQDSDTE
jgi:hypothetical protein